MMKKYIVALGICLVLISIPFAKAGGEDDSAYFLGQNLSFEGKMVEIKIPKVLPDFTFFSMQCVWSNEVFQILRFYQQIDIQEKDEFVFNTYDLFVLKDRPDFVALKFKEKFWIYENGMPVTATKEELENVLVFYSGSLSKI